MSAASTPGPARAGRYSFLREPRWVGLVVIAVLAAMTCVWLGSWQLGRHEDKVERRDAITTAETVGAVPAGELLDDLVVDDDDTWRHVTVTGEYVDGTTLGLRNRPVDGTAAVHVVDLFAIELDGRQAVLPIDRGWVPASPDLAPVDLPRPPAGEATLTLRLRPAEPVTNRDPAPGWLYAIEETALRGALGALPDPAPGAREIAEGGAVVVAGFGEPAPGTTEPTLNALPTPDVSLGNHLSYAFQWWIFAVGALAIVPLLARREVDEADEELLAGTPYARGGALAARPGKKASDADEEDAWLDADDEDAWLEEGDGDARLDADEEDAWLDAEPEDADAAGGAPAAPSGTARLSR